jgi:hypothetical protein
VSNFGIKKIVLFVLIEISQRIRTFEKIEFQFPKLHLFKSYASIFAKEIFYKCYISNKVAMPKAC